MTAPPPALRELVILPGNCAACGGGRCRGHVQGVLPGMERRRRRGERERAAPAPPRRVLEYQLSFGN